MLCWLGQGHWPRVVDVRRRDAWDHAETVIPTAMWREHLRATEWSSDFRSGEHVVAYCAHGEQASQSAATILRSRGLDAHYLVGGLAGWIGAGGPTIDKTALAGLTSSGPSRWVTREQPKIDRIACPWLIKRFLDPFAEFHFVAADWVDAIAVELGGIPFDSAGATLTHEGDHCSFDAIVRQFAITDPALSQLATIVRGADTGNLDLAPQCAGLLAISLGLSASSHDDQEMLERGIVVYDALYAWLRLAATKTHGWTFGEPPEGRAHVVR
jgi:rhodanese-related sulfurtransferase